jgi:chromosome segregation ATPase
MPDKLDLILAAIDGVKEDIHGIKVDLNGIKSELNDVKADISGIKDELNVVKADISGIKDELNVVKSKVAILESNQLIFLQELREMRLENQARDRMMFQEFDRLHSAIRHVNRRLADVELDGIMRKTKKSDAV